VILDLSEARENLKESVISMYCDVIDMLRNEEKIANKILEKNMYCAIAHSGVSPLDWATEEMSRFFASSFETRMGNVLGAYAEDLITLVYPDAEIRQGERKKPVDLDAVFKKGNKQAHLQAKSSDKWGNSAAKEALARKMGEYARTLRDFYHRDVLNIWGYTGGKNYKKREVYHTAAGEVGILVVSNKMFWEFITGVTDFCNTVIVPAIDAARRAMGSDMKLAKQGAARSLREFAEEYTLPSGMIDFPDLYDLDLD